MLPPSFSLDLVMAVLSLSEGGLAGFAAERNHRAQDRKMHITIFSASCKMADSPPIQTASQCS